MLLQIEGQGLSHAATKRAEPKDYILENVRRMRKIQKETKDKQENDKKPMKAVWKSTKYEQVESAVKRELSRVSAPRPQSTTFLRAHSRNGSLSQSSRPATPVNGTEDDAPAAPRSQSARELRLIRRDIDYVNLNGRSARQFSMRKSPSEEALNCLKQKKEEEFQQYKRGEVPRYLRDRQKQWNDEEAQRKASIPDPDLPPGHKLMPNNERRETLEKLRSSKAEVEQAISRLPITADTMRSRNRRSELERKHGEIEEAIKLFSRPKVFVKIDA